MGEIAESFRLHGPQDRATCGDQMPPSHRRAMDALEHCRTAALGGQVYDGEHCHACQDRYHSGKNRPCPTCQNGSAHEWLHRPQAMLLPVPYCLVTLTRPEARRPLARRHQTLFYTILFRSSAQALQELAWEPRFVGGKIGLVGVLHTWTRALHYHPPGHDLVPAGGLAADGRQWLPARDHVLVPVKALSLRFRANVRAALRKTPVFDLVPPTVWEQDWGVHGEPGGTGAPALQYLAPYIFRVAISHNRILRWEAGRVTFQYPDSQTGALQVCTVTAADFLRRFLQHLRPDHCVKVRYDGLLGPSNRDALHKATTLLGGARRHSPPEGHTPAATPPETGLRCPKCAGVMQRLDTLRPTARCPRHRGP
jgi:hypothetical protein